MPLIGISQTNDSLVNKKSFKWFSEVNSKLVASFLSEIISNCGLWGFFLLLVTHIHLTNTYGGFYQLSGTALGSGNPKANKLQSLLSRYLVMRDR